MTPPPLIATLGVVKPNPASVTAILVTTPEEITAVPAAPVAVVTPGELMTTVGGAV